ncbi:MAG: radical SAM protein [Elusimicrobiota bacterium]|jgi:radical SAM protein with 4Fe4S-binding SPASM domain
MSKFQEEMYSVFSARVFSRSVENRSPLKAQLELTYRCNLHCVHCFTDPFNTPTALSRELPLPGMIRILDDLASAGVLWLTLTGGEAVLHPRFKDIYRAAKERGFLIALFTNGTTITDEIADFLAKDPPFQLEVSLHGVRAETFERVTQVPGSYACFQAGIRRLLDRRLSVAIKTKAMTVNRQELGEIRAYVEGLGVDFSLYPTIYPRLNGDLSSTQYRLSGAEVAELEVAEECKPSPAPVRPSGRPACPLPQQGEGGSPADFILPPPVEGEGWGEGPPPDDRLFRCGCGTNQLTVSPYGVFRPCTFTTWPSYDLKTIPVSEAFQRSAEEINQARYTGESACRSCSSHLFCDKNPVMAIHEAGSMEAPVPYFCEVAKARQTASILTFTPSPSPSAGRGDTSAKNLTLPPPVEGEGRGEGASS